MSSIDERIVQMRFDNAQFEKGVSTTLGSLDKLKQGLNFEGSEKGLSALGNAINSVSFSGLSDGIMEVQSHFSAMEAFAFGVIQNIANRVTDLGIHFAKSLTVDQLTAGWQKFEDETRNVTAVINQSGRAIDEVETFVDELNWYADATSYSTSSMTSALSQFISQGIELETAIPAIIGIGNSMTYAGASAQQASNGFQIYARAMAKGSMALHEWRQLQTLRVATAGLKQEFIDAAVAIGNLKEGEVTISSFEDSLQHGDTQGWLTTSVMLDVLAKKYGNFTEDMYKFITAQKDQTGEYLTLNQALDKYDGEVDEFGKKVLLSATLARTLQDAIDAAKDATSSGFAQIFKAIIGNAEEATEVWTDLNDILVTVFSTPITNTANVFKEWNKLGGRDDLLKGLQSLLDGIETLSARITDTLTKVFAPVKAQKLYDITRRFREWADTFKDFTKYSYFFNDITEETRKFGNEMAGLVSDEIMSGLDPGTEKLTRFEQAVKGVVDFFDIINIFGDGFKDNIHEIFPGLGQIANKLLDIASKLGSGISKVREWIKENEIFDKSFKFIFKTLNSFLTDDGIVVRVFEKIEDAINKASSALQAFYDKFKNNHPDGLFELSRAVEKIKNGIKAAFDIVVYFGDRAIDTITKLGKAFIDIFQNANFEAFFGILSGGLVVKILKNFEKLTQGASDLGDTLQNTFTLKGLMANFDGIRRGVMQFLKTFEETKVKASAVKDIAIAILILSGAFLLMSSIPKENLTSAISGLISAVGAVVIATKTMSSLKFDRRVMMSLPAFFVGLGISMALLAAAIKILASVGTENGEIVNGFVGMLGILMALSVFISNTNFKKVSLGLAASFIPLSISVLILAGAIKLLSFMPWQTVAVGIVEIAAMLLLLGGALNAFPNFTPIIAAGIVILSAALLMLTGVLFLITRMDWKTVVVGIASMAGMLLILGGALNAFSAIRTPIIAIGLLILSIALATLAGTLALFSLFDLGKIALGFFELMGALALMSVASIFISAVAKYLLIFAGVSIAASVGIAALGASLAVLGLGVEVFTAGVIGSLRIIGNGIISLIKTIGAAFGWIGKFLGITSSKEMTSGIDNMAEELNKSADLSAKSSIGTLSSYKEKYKAAGIENAMAVGEGFSSNMPNFSNVTEQFSSTGLSNITDSIPSFNIAGDQLSGNLLEGFNLNYDSFIDSASSFGQDGAISLSDSSELFNLSGIELGESGAEGLASTIPSFNESTDSIIDGMLSKFQNGEYDFNIEGINLGEIGADGLSSVSPEWLNSGVELSEAGLDGIYSNFPEMKDIAAKYGISGEEGVLGTKGDWLSAFNELGETGLYTMQEMMPTMESMGINLGNAGVAGLDSTENGWKLSAGNLIKGFLAGLKSKLASVRESAKQIGQVALEATNKQLDINSPSKKFMEIGKFSDLGFAKGLDRFSYAVNNSAEDVGKSALNALEAPMNMLSSAIQDDWDDTLTITPVLNLSEIQNGMSYMNAMMSSSMITPSFNGYAQAASMQQTADLMARLNNLETTMIGLLTATQTAASLNTAAAIRDALAGTGIYMDSRKVGELVSSQQAYMKRTRGL